MRRNPNQFTVKDDAARLRIVLVQRPLGPSQTGRAPDGRHENVSSAPELAVAQHARVVDELRKAGIKVLEFESVLADAVGCADGRDWILERRLGPSNPISSDRETIMSWLQDMAPEALARVLVEGVKPEGMPEAVRRSVGDGSGDAESYLPALPGLTYPRDSIRWLANGVVIGRGKNRDRRAEAVNVATVLHFAPVFDEAHFEFWLTSDGAQMGRPPIDGRDIAMPGESVVVGAMTETTSAVALRQLAAALFRRNIASEMLWLDLLDTGVSHLDDCLVVLDEDCILINSAVLNRTPVFIIRGAGTASIHSVATSRTSFMTLLRDKMAPATLRVIDMSRVDEGSAETTLARMAPLVVMPGKVIAFEEHHAAFSLLEDNGVEVLVAVPGAALMRDGRGPRNLAAVVSAG